MDDVADMAGVSRATVSRVLSGSARVATSTRERVYQAIGELGYVPNLAAQQLAGAENTTLGLLLRDPRVPTYGLLHTELSEQAGEHGAGILAAVPTPTRGADQEQSSLQRLLGSRVGGLFVATGVIGSHDLRPFLSAVPVVSVGRLEADPRIPGVSYDERTHGRMIADWVIRYGHTSVAVLAVREDISLGEGIRSAATIERLRERGCDVREVPATTFGITDENLDTFIHLVREQRITCAIFPTDRRALGFLTLARKTGVRVPEDVSVVGLDGVGVHLSLLGLATLRVPVETVARRAVEVMMAAIASRSAHHRADHGPDAPPTSHELHRGILVEGETLNIPPTPRAGDR